MTDIYDKAIQATLEHDNIRDSWIAGGKSESMPLHGLLFCSCPNLGCCLTESKDGMGNASDDFPPEVQELIENLKNDELIPSSQWKLERRWNDESSIEQRTAMLERFAMYNRELDELFDRETVDIAEE